MFKVADDPQPPSLPVVAIGVRADEAQRAWDARADDADSPVDGDDDEPSDWRVTLATFGVFAGGITALALLAPSVPMVGLLVGASVVMGAETSRQKRRFERWHRRRAGAAPDTLGPPSA